MMYYTVQSVAERIGVSDDTVLNFIHTGKLRAVNVGGGAHRPRWRIAPESLEAFLEARESKAPAPHSRRSAVKQEPIATYF